MVLRSPSRLIRPEISSGVQPSFNFSATYWRVASDLRRARLWAFSCRSWLRLWAGTARYFTLLQLGWFRVHSRLIVLTLRLMDFAITPREWPNSSPITISSRSSSDKWLYELPLFAVLFVLGLSLSSVSLFSQIHPTKKCLNPSIRTFILRFL